MSEREERQPEQLRLSGKRIRWGIMWSILFGARNTTTLKMKILMHELSLGVSLYLLYLQSVYFSLSLSLSLFLELGLFVLTVVGNERAYSWLVATHSF